MYIYTCPDLNSNKKDLKSQKVKFNDAYHFLNAWCKYKRLIKYMCLE